MHTHICINADERRKKIVFIDREVNPRNDFSEKERANEHQSIHNEYKSKMEQLKHATYSFEMILILL